MESVLELLNSIYPLSFALRKHLQLTLKTRALERKQFLLHAGHVCRNICFVQKGLLRCFYEKDNAEVSSWFMTEGDVIVSVESFFFQRISYESIQAVEDCELYCIGYGELENVYRAFPEFNFIGRVLLQKYYTLSEQRLYSLRMQRGRERYEYLLAHYPHLLLRVPAKHIASYLGITEVHLSNIKSGR